MDVRIAQPLGYSELGGRNNNEDSIFPDPQSASTRQKWFLVCDGVGGADRGEVASRLAVTSFHAFFEQHPVAVATDVYLQEAVAYVEEQFNAYFDQHPQAVGMATTLTLLYIHEAGATVAHIGDSRVYHLRNGSIIWRTDDHSYVNELVKAGVISPTEALRHPQRNVITRALQGGDRGVTPSVQILNDLRPGDYFFLCSDGVLERVSDELLEGTLGHPTESNEQKLAQLRQYSAGNTRDNFTAYLVQIEEVSGSIDATYRVPTPLYERHTPSYETDDAVTLINVPLPATVKADPLPSRPEPAASASPVWDNQPKPVPLQSEPVRMAEAPTSREPLRSTVQPTTQRSSKRWLIPVLTIVGAVVGAGGYYIWQEFLHEKGSAELRVKPVTQQLPVPGNASRPAVASAIPTTDAANESAGSKSDFDEQNEEDAPKAKSGSSPGLTVEPDAENPSETTKSVEALYDPIREVNEEVVVVRDHKTRLLGLRKIDGQRLTPLVYKEIGDFAYGVAEVETGKGRKHYIHQTGMRLTSVGDFEANGLATVTTVEGKRMYLNKNGRLFDEVREPSNGRMAAREDKLWGYLNMEGRVSNYIQYEKAGQFREDGTAEVVLRGKTLRIGKDGKPVAEKKEAQKKS